MSATLSDIASPAGTNRPGVLVGISKACWDAIARYLVRRAAIASLHELDDDALRDIGLERREIEAAVRGLRTTANPTGR